jgi:hypothetical protein
MDSDYSDNESVSSAFSESMQTADLFDALELGKDPKAYKSDKNCTVCNAKFGKVGVFHARKHYCKFCYRGVCAQCSPQVAVHPVQLKKLRVCNSCCQKAVIYKFSENFKLDIEHVMNEQDKVKNNIKKSKEEKVEIENRIEELKTLHEEAMSKELTFIQIKKMNFELEKVKTEKSKKKDEVMTSHVNFKLLIQGMEKNLNGLENEFAMEKDKVMKVRSELFELKNRIVEKQDQGAIIRARIEEAKEKHEKMMKLSKEFEKIDKMKKELADIEAGVNQELTLKQSIIQDLIRTEEEGKEIDVKIIECKNKSKEPEVLTDALVSTTPGLFNEEEEKKVSELKKIQKEKQAIIENLKIQLIKSNQKSDDPFDIEHSSLDKTRPCVRCVMI